MNEALKLDVGDARALPRPAATVVLLRPGPTGDLEVLLTRRKESLAFFGGAYVFPGGRIDSADLLAADALGPDNFPNQLARMHPTPGTSLEPREALAFYVGAIRELFEEVGVLLARRRDGSPATLDAHTLEILRSTLGHDDRSFLELLQTHDLWPAVERLVPWAHWVTPSVEVKRYDTRFFVALLPEGQEAHVNAEEATELLWISPNQALLQAHEKELVLPPPTVRNLEDLAIAPTPAAAWELSQVRRIAAIMPKIVAGEPATILLPWDPDFASAPGEALPMDTPHPMAGGPSRLVLEDGVWWSRVSA